MPRTFTNRELLTTPAEGLSPEDRVELFAQLRAYFASAPVRLKPDDDTAFLSGDYNLIGSHRRYEAGE
jgi:hypothetical protein